MSLEAINSSVSMFPLNLQLTPTHKYNIAATNKGCMLSVYLIKLSHVTINQSIHYSEQFLM